LKQKKLKKTAKELRIVRKVGKNKQLMHKKKLKRKWIP
jgi:hypothetical protein